MALSKAKKLVEMDKIDVLTGVLMASEGYAIAPYLDSKEIPMLFPVVAADDLTQRERAKWLLRVGFNSSQASHPFGEYAYKVLGYRKVVAICTDYALGWEMLGGFQKTFEELGGRVTKKIWCPTNASDFSPYLSLIPKDTDAVFAMFGGRLAIQFMKQYQEAGLKNKIPLIGGAPLTDESVLPSMGDEALGVITPCHYSAALDNPANKEFVKKYRAKFGKVPSYFSESCYTTMRWINEAAGKLKGDVSNKKQFFETLRAIHLTGLPRGPMRLDAYANPVQNVYIRKVERKGNELQNTVIYTYNDVSQFWKYKPEDYLKLPVYSRDYPPLK
jgi:branched-chain amino acid transport system substrate-binding protein